MKASYKILSVLGIDIEAHITFLVFLLAIALLDFRTAVLLSIVFIFVTLHELSHSIVALRNRIKVRRILLMPIGGMAMIDVSDMKPLTEIRLAVAGPLFNFAVCIALIFLMGLLGLPISDLFNVLGQTSISAELMIYYAFYANLILGTFNLLPAFPLDGGRIFRGLLALKLDYVRATGIAKNSSLVIAGLIFIAAVVSGDLWMMILTGFIAFGAVGEYNSLVSRRALDGISVRDVISAEFIMVNPSANVVESVPELLGMKTAVVLVNSKPLTVADLRMVQNLPVERRQSASFEDIGVKVPRFTANSSVRKMSQFMGASGIGLVPVFSEDRIIGVVRHIDIERVKQVKEAINKQ